MDKIQEFEITFSGYFDSKYIHNCEDGFITPERVLTDYEIELYHENKGEVIVDNIPYKILPNTVLVGKPGQKRYAKLNFRTYYIHIRVSECGLKRYLDNLPVFFEIENSMRYMEILSKLNELHEKNFPGKELCVGKALYELVFLLYKDSNRTHDEIQIDVANKHYMEMSRKFIKENYPSPIKLKDISSHVNLSPIYFHKLFTKCYGESPISYLQEIRLFNAKKLLCTTDYPSERIAELCGFSSQSYFNYFFKKKVSMTPLQFRKKAFQEYEI